MASAILKRLRRNLWKLLTWLPVAFVGIRALWATLPAPGPGTAHSTRNDLLFGLAPAQSPLRAYGPVPITAGVVPKRFHSHNDYVQSVPLLKALSHGAASVEADIWLVDGELYIAHDAEDVRPERTLAALYLDPLRAILDAANLDRSTDTRPKGVFALAPALSLHLLVDIKTDGPTTFAALHAALAPLRAAGYLTTWTGKGEGVEVGPLTVIGTGNTPPADVAALVPRDIFLDAVLDQLPPDLEYTVAPLASVDLRRAVGPAAWVSPGLARARVRELVEATHARGIQARFWRIPSTPVALRNSVWQMLLDEGVDWLNVDDLPAAQAF